MALTRIQKAMLWWVQWVKYSSRMGNLPYAKNRIWGQFWVGAWFGAHHVPNVGQQNAEHEKSHFLQKIKGGLKKWGLLPDNRCFKFSWFFWPFNFWNRSSGPKIAIFSQKYARLAILGRNRPGRLLGWLVSGCEARASLTIERLRQVLRCCGKLSTVCQQKSDVS